MACTFGGAQQGKPPTRNIQIGAPAGSPPKQHILRGSSRANPHMQHILRGPFCMTAMEEVTSQVTPLNSYAYTSTSGDTTSGLPLTTAPFTTRGVLCQ